MNEPSGLARLALMHLERVTRWGLSRGELLREAFRLSKAELPAGIDLVVIPRRPSLTFAAARRSLPILARAVARRLGSSGAKAPP